MTPAVMAGVLPRGDCMTKQEIVDKIFELTGETVDPDDFLKEELEDMLEQGVIVDPDAEPAKAPGEAEAEPEPEPEPEPAPVVDVDLEAEVDLEPGQDPEPEPPAPEPEPEPEPVWVTVKLAEDAPYANVLITGYGVVNRKTSRSIPEAEYNRLKDEYGLVEA